MSGFLLLAMLGLQTELAAGEALPLPEVKLVCRYDKKLTLFALPRKMCLTAPEWEKRDQEGEAASQLLKRGYLGDTNCLGKGVCTDL